MSEKHIHRLIWLGLVVEALAVLTVVAALFCGIIQIVTWTAEHVPDWAIPLLIGGVPVIGIMTMVWDTVRSMGEPKEGER